MKLGIHRFAVWSNLFYLVPIVLALYFHLALVAFIVLLLFLLSSAFHVLGEREFIRLDVAIATTVVMVNVLLLYFSEFNSRFLPAVLALTVIAFGIRFIIERGDRGGTAHGFWHLIAAAITSLCLLSYALPF